MRIAPKILLIYSTIVSIFLVVSSFFSGQAGVSVEAVMLTPVSLYFLITLINASFKKNYDFGYNGTKLQIVMAFLLLFVLAAVSLINITKII